MRAQCITRGLVVKCAQQAAHVEDGAAHAHWLSFQAQRRTRAYLSALGFGCIWPFLLHTGCVGAAHCGYKQCNRDVLIVSATARASATIRATTGRYRTCRTEKRYSHGHGVAHAPCTQQALVTFISRLGPNLATYYLVLGQTNVGAALTPGPQTADPCTEMHGQQQSAMPRR